MSPLTRLGLVVTSAALVTVMSPALATAAPHHHAARRPAPPALVPVDIGTVPAVAGFPVTLDGITRQTDADGVAHFTAKNNRSLGQRVVLHDATMTIKGVPAKVSGQRLYGTPNHPRIMLDVSYLMSFNFANINGGRIDAGEIKTVTVKSVTGLVAKIPAHEPSWLQGKRVVPLAGGLDVKDLYWTVQDVQYAGSNVVNASQQRFFPARQQNVKVQLLFYGVKLHVRDALFGYSEGNAVDLVYPNGTTSRIKLDKHGRLELPALPRGNYTITAVGPGPRMSRPVAISRNQVVDLKFYSWVDIMTLGGLGLVLTVGGLWWGHVRRRRGSGGEGRRRAPAAGVATAEAVTSATQSGTGHSAPQAPSPSDRASRPGSLSRSDAEEAEPLPRDEATTGKAR
jgi:hypothetical protein